MPNTIILQYWDVLKLFNHLPCPQLDKLDINNYDFIVGPHLINQNHWTAIIIDIKKKLFLSIDPQKYKSHLLDIHFNSWLQYYESQGYLQSTIWKKIAIDHPIQTDTCNCGVFVMLLIEQYIQNGKISFNTNNMHVHRLKIAETIKNFSSL